MSSHRPQQRVPDTRGVIGDGKRAKGLTPGLPAAEEEVGGPRGDGDDGHRDGHRGLQPLPVQELHAPRRALPLPSPLVGSALDSRAGVWFGLVWSGGVVRA